MEYLRKYNTATHIYIPIVKRAVVDHAVGADWTPVAGDVMVSIDGGAFANIGTLPVAIAATRGACWDFVFTGGELTGKKIYIEICDAATKAIEDQAFTVITYGNAAAEIVQDISASVAQTIDIASRLTAARAGVIDALSLRTGTAQAGAAGTITLDAGASATDNLYRQQWVVITSGTGAGQSRLISGYVGATKVATVHGNWAVNPDNTSVFYLLSAADIFGLVLADTATAVTNDVGITQAGADKVWTTAARTLTAFAFSVTVGTNNDKTGYALSSAGIQAIFDFSTTLLTVAGSIGKLFVDNLNATVSSRATPAQVATELGTYDAPTKAEMDTAFAANAAVYADKVLARDQKGGADAATFDKSVAAALAGGLMRINIAAGVLTVLNSDGTTAFTRTLTRSALNAIVTAVP